jgi:hypothetical protein
MPAASALSLLSGIVVSLGAAGLSAGVSARVGCQVLLRANEIGLSTAAPLGVTGLSVIGCVGAAIERLLQKKTGTSDRIEHRNL